MNQYLPNNIEILQKRIEEELFFIEKMKKEAKENEEADKKSISACA